MPNFLEREPLLASHPILAGYLAARKELDRRYWTPFNPDADESEESWLAELAGRGVAYDAVDGIEAVHATASIVLTSKELTLLGHGHAMAEALLWLSRISGCGQMMLLSSLIYPWKEYERLNGDDQFPGNLIAASVPTTEFSGVIGIDPEDSEYLSVFFRHGWVWCDSVLVVSETGRWVATICDTANLHIDFFIEDFESLESLATESGFVYLEDGNCTSRTGELGFRWLDEE